MKIRLEKRYLYVLLSFFLGVICSAAFFYFLFYDQTLPASTNATQPEDDRKSVFLNPNDLVVQKTSKNVMIDGVERILPEETPLLKYQDKIYAPIEIMSEHLGKTYTEAANGIVIGNYSALESISFVDSVIPFSYIGSSFTREQMEEKLGEPLHEQELHIPASGGTETVVEYTGAVVHYSTNVLEPKVLRIIVTEPIMMTKRGITVGSTKEEVLSRYGEPEPDSTDEHWFYGETYTLWFHIKEDQVVEFGNLYIDLDENEAEETGQEENANQNADSSNSEKLEDANKTDDIHDIEKAENGNGKDTDSN